MSVIYQSLLDPIGMQQTGYPAGYNTGLAPRTFGPLPMPPSTAGRVGPTTAAAATMARPAPAVSPAPRQPGVMPWGAMALPNGVNLTAPTQQAKKDPYGMSGQTIGHGLIGLGAGLMQAAAPSTDPRALSFGGALGAGLQGMYAGLNQGMQLDEYRRQRRERDRQQKAREDLAAQFDGTPYGPLMRAGYDREAVAALLARPKDERTALMKNYQAAKEGGYTGSITDFMQMSSPGVSVNVGGPETPNIAGNVEDRYMNFIAQEETARDMLRSFDQLDALIEDSYQGPTGEFKLAAGRYLQALGLSSEEVDRAVAGTEAFRSEGLKQVMNFVQQTKGAISNAEMALFQSASPGLANTKPGNKLIVEIGRRAAERQAAVAEYAAQLVEDAAANGQSLNVYQLNRLVRDFVAQEAERNPIVTPEELGQVGGARTVTQEELDG